jgi:hypothetical protein
MASTHAEGAQRKGHDSLRSLRTQTVTRNLPTIVEPACKVIPGLSRGSTKDGPITLTLPVARLSCTGIDGFGHPSGARGAVMSVLGCTMTLKCGSVAGTRRAGRKCNCKYHRCTRDQLPATAWEHGRRAK